MCYRVQIDEAGGCAYLFSLMGEKFFIRTFGCQMNEHDSEKIRGLLVHMGMEEAESEREADVVILNTCAVREKPVHKVYSELGRFKRWKDKIFAVCGCVAQKEGKRLVERMPHVSIVIGPRNIYRLPEAIERAKQGKRSIFTEQNGRCPITDLRYPIKRRNPYRAYVTIMEGCDNFCSYCIVPFVRGREVSRPWQEILDEVKRLADEGYKEVTLLGQNVNSYGKGLEDPIDFPDLLYKIHEVEGIEWIRFITSHPKDFSEKLIDAVVSLPKICEYIHLPAQSGSNRILSLMNRRYTREQYLGIIDRLKSSGKYFAFTSDFIVGFPTETEEDFEQTLSLIREVEYEGVFAFMYNPREFTRAYSWEDDVPPEVKRERLRRLLSLQDEITEKLSSSYVGRVVDVLFDEYRDGCLYGRTRTFKIVKASGDKSLLGNIVKVKITEARMYELKGEIVQGGMEG